MLRELSREKKRKESEYLLLPSIPKPHILPKFALNSIAIDDEDEGVNIWLDWPTDAILFSVHNLKVFESLLSVYPEAHFKILLAAPENKENESENIYNPYNIKTHNLLSKIHFIKYQRLDYDIEIVQVGEMHGGHTSHIAQNYWTKWGAKCCSEKSANFEIERTQPYHVLTFIRLSKLWRKGGIFSDFSFFFLGPTDAPVAAQVKKIIYFVLIHLFTVILCNYGNLNDFMYRFLFLLIFILIGIIYKISPYYFTS